MPTKTTMQKKSAVTPKAKLTKSGYVRSLPASLSAKDVIAKAKTVGLSLSEAHVYAIRSEAKRKKKNGVHKAPAVHHTSHAVGSHQAEELLKALGAELGFTRAMSVLRAEHDRVHRLLSVVR